MAEDIQNILEKMSEEIKKHTEIIETICASLDSNFREVLDDMRTTPPLKGKKKKEALNKILAQQHPKLYKLLEDYSSYIDALEWKLQELADRLEEQEEAINDIESLQDEIEDRKRQLD
jgi:ribosome-binding protein aMBF1 (putative translation factor)